MTPECADLHPYVDGELELSRLPSFETHLLTCAECQRGMVDLMQLATLAEEAAVKRPARSRILAFRRPPTVAMALAASLLLSVATGAGLWRSWGAGSDGELWLSNAPSRLLEARVSRPEADRFRPYDVARAPTVAVPTPPLTALGALERRGDRRGIAVAYLVRRQPAQAEPYLDAEDTGAEVQVDRSAAALLRDDAMEALERADRALGARPGYAPALWNRALALKGMGLPRTAAEAFDQVAALEEPGWSQEARDRARQLRADDERRERDWRTLQEACRKLASEGTPIPGASLRAFPGPSRACFYEGVRQAPSRERVQGLVPMAETLDAVSGDHVLAGYARRIAARDFARRRPLVEAYAALVAGSLPPGEVGPLLDRLRAAGESDLLLGALLHLPSMGDRMGEYVALAAASEDPFLQLQAEAQQADLEVSRDQVPRAVERLEGALRRCQSSALGSVCLELERTLSYAYAVSHQLVPARERARRAQADARREGEWAQETSTLFALGQIARLERDLPLTHAFLEEGLRRTDNCGTRTWIQGNLALAYWEDFQVPAARRALDPGPGCKPPPDLTRIELLADLSRRDPKPEDAAQMAEMLKAVRADPDLPPGRRVEADQYEGRFLIERDRAAGQALLRRAISAAAALPESETNAQKARAYAYTALLMDAGKHGEFDRAPALFAEELGAPAPASCALFITMDDERTLAVARGPKGELVGHYDEDRRAPLAEVSGLVPDRLRQALRGCAAVQVIARPPLAGQPDLLPPEIAWSYRLSRGEGGATPARAAKRLLVTSATPPASLHLAPLAAPAPPAGPEWTVLKGEAATPGQVLEAMKGATEIQIHAHGLVNPDRSTASFIALSPDAKGEFALTASDLERVRLEGRPVVLLAACYSAKTARDLHESHGLAAAFVRAGARVVLAATQEIPDQDAPRFFDLVLERIRQGQPAAAALHDERQAWVARGGGRWVDHVLLFD
jgi:CHAT domain-containing protein